MTQMDPYKRGVRDGIQFAVTWLHRRATEEMNDPKARAILNSAATNLGWDKDGRIQDHMIKNFGHAPIIED